MLSYIKKLVEMLPWKALSITDLSTSMNDLARGHQNKTRNLELHEWDDTLCGIYPENLTKKGKNEFKEI